MYLSNSFIIKKCNICGNFYWTNFRVVTKCPGLARTVPEFGPMSALSQNPARLHEWRCGTSINRIYYISACISVFSPAYIRHVGPTSLQYRIPFDV